MFLAIKFWDGLFPSNGLSIRALTMLFCFVIFQDRVMICSVFETYLTTNLLLFPLSLFCVYTHEHSREHTHLGKHCSRSHITRVTRMCSFVGFMENSCFSFMSTSSFHCCSENSYLNGTCNSQCYNDVRPEKLPKHSPLFLCSYYGLYRTI